MTYREKIAQALAILERVNCTPASISEAVEILRTLETQAPGRILFHVDYPSADDYENRMTTCSFEQAVGLARNKGTLTANARLFCETTELLAAFDGKAALERSREFSQMCKHYKVKQS